MGEATWICTQGDSPEATVIAGAVTDLSVLTTNLAHVTNPGGGPTITGFGPITNTTYELRYDAGIVIQNNANVTLLSGGNRTTSQGDRQRIRADNQGNIVELSYGQFDSQSLANNQSSVAATLASLQSQVSTVAGLVNNMLTLGFTTTGPVIATALQASGNITSTGGAISASGNITTSGGSLVATVGNVSVGNAVEAAQNVYALFGTGNQVTLLTHLHNVNTGSAVTFAPTEPS